MKTKTCLPWMPINRRMIKINFLSLILGNNIQLIKKKNDLELDLVTYVCVYDVEWEKPALGKCPENTYTHI